jgi:hypothetical protein
MMMSEEQVVIWNVRLMVSIYEVPKADGESVTGI